MDDKYRAILDKYGHVIKDAKETFEKHNVTIDKQTVPASELQKPHPTPEKADQADNTTPYEKAEEIGKTLEQHNVTKDSGDELKPAKHTPDNTDDKPQRGRSLAAEKGNRENRTIPSKDSNTSSVIARYGQPTQESNNPKEADKKPEKNQDKEKGD